MTAMGLVSSPGLNPPGATQQARSRQSPTGNGRPLRERSDDALTQRRASTSWEAVGVPQPSSLSPRLPSVRLVIGRVPAPETIELRKTVHRLSRR